MLSHLADLEEDVWTYRKCIGGQQAQAVAAYPWHPPNLLQTVSGPSLNTQGQARWDLVSIIWRGELTDLTAADGIGSTGVFNFMYIIPCIPLRKGAICMS